MMADILGSRKSQNFLTGVIFQLTSALFLHAVGEFRAKTVQCGTNVVLVIFNHKIGFGKIILVVLKSTMIRFDEFVLYKCKFPEFTVLQSIKIRLRHPISRENDVTIGS